MYKDSELDGRGLVNIGGRRKAITIGALHLNMKSKRLRLQRRWKKVGRCILVSLGCYNKLPQTRWLKQHNLFSVLETEESKVKMPAYSVFGEGPLSGLKMTTFLLYPHMAERGSYAVSSSSYKGTNPILRAQLSG